MRRGAAHAAVLLAAALVLAVLAPRPAAAQDAAITSVPEACKKVHIDDYVKDLPIVMANGSATDAFCPGDASSCTDSCKHAIQRLGYDCVAYVRGATWLISMLATCKMHPDDVNPCTAKEVPKESQQLYGPALASCPALANQTCSCGADEPCIAALYWLGRCCAKHLGFAVGPFTPSDTHWNDLYTKCGVTIGGFERDLAVPCSSSSSSLGVGAIVGIVVGVVAALAVAVAGFLFYRRRKQRKQLGEGSAKGDLPDAVSTTATAGGSRPIASWNADAAVPGAPGPSPFFNVPMSVTHNLPTPPGQEEEEEPCQGTGRDLDTAQSLASDPLFQYLRAKRLVSTGGSRTAASNAAVASRGTVTSRGTAASSVTVGSQLSAGTAGTAGTAATAGTAPSRRSATGVNVQPWEIAYQDLQLLEECGEGSFGRVFRAKWHETEVAAKVLLVGGSGNRRAASIPTHALLKLEEEASLLASLRHPNVVSFYGICRDPPCIVTEYCANGSLTDTLAAARESPSVAALLVWPRRLAMALDAANGMLYLHNRSTPIVHRDLKSPNLLVDRHLTLKVTDFNLSRILEVEGASQTSSGAVMNPRWLAPEVMQGQHATPAADVFSFGVVLWELATWQLPFAELRHPNQWQLATLVVNGRRPDIPPRDQLPGADTPDFQGLDAYLALLQCCWASDPAERPTFQHIVHELRALLDQTAAEHGAALLDSSAARHNPKVHTSGGSSY
ncbi:hypothetical protein ABPG75_011445 [Micractinium tetrahymenae]